MVVEWPFGENGAERIYIYTALVKVGGIKLPGLPAGGTVYRVKWVVSSKDND